MVDYIESPIDRIVGVHWDRQPPVVIPPDSLSFYVSGVAFTLNSDDPTSLWVPPTGGIYGLSGTQGSFIHTAEGNATIGLSRGPFDQSVRWSISGGLTAQVTADFGGSAITGTMQIVEAFPNDGAVLAEGGGVTQSGVGTSSGGEMSGGGTVPPGGMAIRFLYQAQLAGGPAVIGSILTYPLKLTLTAGAPAPPPPPH
jgi:hypothetical protein